MLNFLFRRLTARPELGAPLFDAITQSARERHWYVEGRVHDTLDGRFAVLATIAALVLTRLERDGEAGDSASVALTERFVEVLESEHRELGIGDPTLGRTVRKLVGSLARRTELWRSATAGQSDWIEAARESLYKGAVAADALVNSSAALQRLWHTLEQAELSALEQGKWQ
jgi:cytochrome b pre-mRNA-processing protein 3